METQLYIAHNHKPLGTLAATILAVGLLVLAGPVAAEGWYAGVSSGNAENRNWCDGNLAACDDKDSGWKIFAGNQLNRFVGFEFGYNDLGKFAVTGTTAEPTGLVASLIGMIPVGDMFSITGRVGTFHWENDIRSTTPDLTRKRDGTNLTVGIGAIVPLGKHVILRVEWEHYDVDDDDISFLTAGVGFSFGK